MRDVEPAWEQTGTPRKNRWTGILIALLIVVCAAACAVAVQSRQDAARLRSELAAVSGQVAGQTEEFNIEGAKAYIDYLESQISYSAGNVTMTPDFDALRKQFNYEP